MNDHRTASRKNLTRDTLALYSNAHKWLLIPIVVILVAFTPLYFATFTSEPWAYHTHALSAIAWYVLMITQPYLATRGRLKDHRKWGMVGLLVAGAFIATGLSITPTNVYFGLIGGFPPVFPAEFFYGLTLTETLAMIGTVFFGFMSVLEIGKRG